LAGVLAGDELGNLMPTFTQGKRMSDAQVLAQLTSMVVAALKAPSPAPQELGALQDVFEIGETQHADEQAHLAALAATVEAESHEAAAAAAAALGRARRSARQVRNEERRERPPPAWRYAASTARPSQATRSTTGCEPAPGPSRQVKRWSSPGPPRTGNERRRHPSLSIPTT
jgi:hypothetical protein